MLLVYLCLMIIWFRGVISQPSSGNLTARGLDSLLQDYAFRALVRPRTGIVYDGSVPHNLTGIGVAALRLRSGSLRRRGVPRYKEFRVPVGVVERPYVERLVLVYHNLGNWSSLYYPLPGYTFLAPVLGLLAYDASDLSAKNLSELHIRVSGDPISVKFPSVRSGTQVGSPPRCVHFGLDGSVRFDDVVGDRACLINNQGHFSIAVETLAAPAPAPGGEGKGRSKRVWVIAGTVIGGAAVLAVLGVAFACVTKCRHREKMRRMENASESGAPLPMVRVGHAKAPVALETRTRPFLEGEFVP